MRYGLIGEKLGHSFSKLIHEQLMDDTYELIELPPESLKAFMKEKGFLGINVTIPYKQAVLPYLDEIHPAAANIGAVNTVVNVGGKLIGYNTDYLGLKALIERNRVSLRGAKVLILGSGGTSLTAKQVALDMGARAVYRVSRGQKEGCITYAQAYSEQADADVLIQTTPVGMYPHTEGVAVELDKFSNLKAVFDAVYNPLCTDLVLQARERGITAEGGLYMLVAQAVFASEYFLQRQYAPEVFERVYQSLYRQKCNIVLSGMPGSGKSTVGKLLAKQLGRCFKDTDILIEQKEGRAIRDIFETDGEAYFRRIESEVIAALSDEQGLVIALGGGAVLHAQSVHRLKRNGSIYFLNRDVRDLVPTDDRPLALTRQAIQQRFEERYATYLASADTEIKVTGDAQSVAEQIGKDFQIES